MRSPSRVVSGNRRYYSKDGTAMARTPLDAAESNGRKDVVELLRRAEELLKATKEAGKNQPN
jgi:hypothetical protein